MKKRICLLLVLALLLSMLPMSVYAEAAVPITFTGTADWLTGSARVDQTKDLELSYDIHLGGITLCTTKDKWVDEGKLVIRNETADHYIYFSIQTYCNGSGKYQIAVSSQVWSGAWSDRAFTWSQEYDAPITDGRMSIQYNATTKTYSWTLKNSSGDVTVNAGTVSPAVMTEELQSCTSCAVTFYRSSVTDITISNATMLQKEPSGVNPLPDGALAVAFSGSGDRLVANTRIDQAREFTFGYDLKLPAIASVTANDTWADESKLVIRNELKDHYIYFSVQSFRSGEGKYQIATSSQVWDSKGWSDRAFEWSPVFDEPVTEVHMEIKYDPAAKQYTWTLTQPGSDSLLNTGSIDPAVLTPELTGCGDCEVALVKTAGVEISNAYLSYKPEAGVEFDETMTPASFGWNTDGANFTNWKTTGDGSMFYINYNGANSQRIWKDLIANPDNFTLKVTVQVENHRAYIELMGVAIELDCNGGNGNQICEKFSGSYQWLDARQQCCEVTVARANGGDLEIQFMGKGNPTPMRFTVTPKDEANTAVIMGVYDNPGAAFFSDIQAMGLEGQKVEDFGWLTDETAGVMDFSGWTSVDGVTITANAGSMTGTHRIWKDMLTDSGSFAVQLSVSAQDATAYVKLLGQRLKLSGTDDELAVTLNGENMGSITAKGGNAKLFFTRRQSGSLSISLLGQDSYLQTYTIAEPDDSASIELGAEAGISVFSGITVKKPSECMRSIPLSTAVFAGELSGDWTDLLMTDMAEYQNCPIKKTVLQTPDLEALLEADADLTVLCSGTQALLSGMSAQDFIAAYRTLLTALKIGLQENSVVLLTGIPYLTDEALGDISVETYAAYNAGLRALAEEQGVLFADLYAAMGNRSWTVQADGKTLSALGNSLAEGEVIERLMRSCTCLAVNSTTTLRTTLAVQTGKTETALNTFKTAATADELRAAVTNKETGLNLILYHMLTSTQQNAVIEALLAEERSGITSFFDADLLFTTVLLRYTRLHPAQTFDKEIKTILAVGASCTEGTAAVNPKTDAWPIRLGMALDTFNPEAYTVINKGIAGTRMCTVTDNGLFPAAKDTVDEYIVSVNPDLLLITYGFNDINAGTGLEEYISTYRSYLQEIRSKCPDTVIVMAGIQPTFGETNKEVAGLWSAAIKELAEEHGCIYAYKYDDTAGVNWLLSDGVHPTNAGYRVMANAMLRILNANMDLSAEAITYTVTWSVNGVTTTEDYAEGENPVFKGSTDKPADNEYSYSFIGWSPAIVPVSGDITYTAQYDRTPLACEHEWVLDGDKSVAATCTENGKNVYACSKCGESKEETVEALGHDFAKTDEDYFYTYYECSRCDESKAEEKEPFAYESSPSAAYSDIKDGWYRHAADYVLHEELMGSTSTTEKTFEPNTNMSRAMLVSVLYRLEGNQKVENPSKSFTDVPAGKWYTDAVIWAAENGIVSGTGNGTTFSPNDNITREQIAAILYNYCKNYKKLDVSKTDDLKSFEDAEKVSSWAITAVKWAVAEKLISGRVTGGKTLLVPQGNALRCEVASVLMSFAKNITVPAAHAAK